ncbi:putative E3 ubiquitin-protein ligase UBR7 [Leguminivora glycinivorella]|uniref:putative E3 ubiquitin-protein ligase UBR7 n=1 Tax=Leguminivora glycinivorella TaxID=1035111 RepID=UPI00200D0281|nr:putative E3 ubiquitin-protein ligase UBR7 [Leguminivora glycinivorella]
MSTNGANGEDTEMAECEGEKVVTMMDVLQEQQEFEEDANAVLGASDDKNCTYNKGYIKRQAVYACLTCCSDAKNDPEKRAGVCLACSLTCHENHDLVELYTKRNFRCDCGNPKFNHPCQYTESKTSLNDENIYNQNFSGLYCTCHRPYPDPDGVEEEMIQCIVCEDWLHSSHLEATVPAPELYAEMICKACMESNDFLHDYSKYAVNGEVDVVSVSESDDSKHCNGDITEMNGANVKTDNVEDESAKDSGILAKVDNLTEPDTSHDTVENNSKEQMDVTVTEKTDNENPTTDNSDEGQAEPVKTSNENPVENDLINPIEDSQAKDDQEVKLSSDEISENQLSGSTNPVTSSEDQANIDATNNEGNGMPYTTEQQEDCANTSHVSNTGDVNGDQPKVETDEGSKVDSQEKQDLADLGTVENTNVETSQVTNNHFGDEEIKENKRKLSTEESTLDAFAKKPKLSNSDCIRPQGGRKMFKGATFWPSHFRQKLCTCNECIAMYKDLSVLFLIDPEDTVTAYEVLGKEKTDGAASTQYEKGLEALSSLGRIQQINALTEYNKMRDKLLDFLKSFKDRREVVKEEDIKAFFAGMKPKREPDGVYFCR